MSFDVKAYYPYLAILIELIQNFLNVLVNLLEKKSVYLIFILEMKLLGFKSCGIPPRKTLQDNDGGRIENVRGRTGNGDVQIKPG